jgi:nitroimidazol reductase NimA-like FMN-containing flavoprotein (pyridoxamine 5'-phosphate oxidase superfamily)
MRRQEKEILDKDIIERILKESDICRIAMIDGSEPYIVPLNYGYVDGVIYIHSAPEGRKISILSANNRVCFEIEYAQKVVKKKEPCNWTTKYRSVIGYGNIEIVSDTENKKKGLNIIMRKYGYKGKSDYNEGLLNWVILLKLKIEKVTGKQSGDW